MICTEATESWAIARRASSTVSTDTPQNRMTPEAASASIAANAGWPGSYTAGGGQCSCTRSRQSTPRFSRLRSVKRARLAAV